jgi:hypothetical protein
MPITFTEATTENSFVRMAIVGASGCGKTLTALKIAKHLGSKVVVIDTERDTAKLYADHPDTPKPYYIYNLRRFEPDAYCMVIDEVLKPEHNFDVCIVDGISPSWNGSGGVLDIAGENIRGWKVATPAYNKLVEKLTGQNNRLHMIVTMRSKMDYALETNPSTGRLEVTKLGMAPIHRDEMQYEWDIVGDIDRQHIISFAGIGKSRFPLLDNQKFANPGADVAAIINRALGRINEND